jgi:hypothetical protein
LRAAMCYLLWVRNFTGCGHGEPATVRGWCTGAQRPERV